MQSQKKDNSAIVHITNSAPARWRLSKNIIYAAIFWLWNITVFSLTFLTYLGILPLKLITDVVEDSFYYYYYNHNGEIPFYLPIFYVGLIVIPTIGSLIGWRYFRQQPDKLIRLFYMGEVPLFLVCLRTVMWQWRMVGDRPLFSWTSFLAIAFFLLDLKNIKNLKFNKNIIFQAIFWGWNIICFVFTSSIYLGILAFQEPYCSWSYSYCPPEQLKVELPFYFFICYVGLIAIPTLGSLIGWRYFRQQPAKLIRLFYLGEAPLFLVCFVAVTSEWSLSSNYSLFNGTGILAIASFLLDLKNLKPLSKKIFSTIFWLWNITVSILTLLTYLGILPLQSIRNDFYYYNYNRELPFYLPICYVGLIVIPTLGSLIGWRYFRQQSEKMIRLFYFGEAPLFLLCLLLVISEWRMVGGEILFFGTIILAIASLLIDAKDLKDLRNIIFQASFWLWNITLIIFTSLGYIWYMWFAKNDSINYTDKVGLSIWYVVSLVILILGSLIGWRYFRQHPPRLIRLFYLGEAPLFLVCLAIAMNKWVSDWRSSSQGLFGLTISLAIASFGSELIFFVFNLIFFTFKLLRISKLNFIFGLWNLAFLILSYVFILPQIGIPLVTETFTGRVPFQFFISFVALIAVPTLCTFVGWRHFRNQPEKINRLFYGVEAPLFILCSIRLLLLRELTLASNLIIGTIVIVIGAFLMELIWGYAERNSILAWLQIFAHSLMVLVAFYVGVILLFYALPLTAAIGYEFVKFQWLESIWRQLSYGDFWVIVYVPFYIFSIFLILLIPWKLIQLYIQSGRRILGGHASQYGQNRTRFGSIAVLSAWIFLFISCQQQPQVEAFKLIETIKPSIEKIQPRPVSQLQNQRQKLLASSELIRDGLVNAYLSPYRYLKPLQDSQEIGQMYSNIFHLPKSVCDGLQGIYNYLLSPFLYSGNNLYDAPIKASGIYAYFFDKPIQKAEKDAIVRALESTGYREGVAAGVLNINQQKVWLKKQSVTVQPQGDWADIEIYEIYQNQTFEPQEILYYFSLPESAVLTGVWLGETEDKSKRFPFIVSPRGAAQKIYNQQVWVRRDPALVEQVGPRQYRLRAFPIPAKSLSGQTSEMHLWLTYKVMQQKEGWPLPKIGEKRNIFWTQYTKRIRNGKQVKIADNNWLEAFLPAAEPLQPKSHQVNLSDGYVISAKPLTSQDYALPQGKRWAVILDSSRSMETQRQKVIETFNWLKKNGFSDNKFANNDADLYLTVSAEAKPERIDDLSQFNPAKITFFGSIQVKEMLRQFVQLRGDTKYDGILVVTDEGSYELSDNDRNVPVMPAPLWMVHLGAFPAAYDDGTLQAIQKSGGGVSDHISEIFQRIATQQVLGESVVSVVDGYAWFMEKTSGEVIDSEKFNPLAARQLILGLSKQVDLSQVSQLDRLHKIAKYYNVVSPYSSMIVLVNEQQKEALEEAEAGNERFDRSVETGTESLRTPFTPSLDFGLSQANKGKQAEGKQYISAINKAQQAYYTENGEFTVSWEELGVGIRTVTANYEYFLRVTKEAAFSYAKPRSAAMKAYIGAVFLVGTEGQDKTSQAIVCEATTAGINPIGDPIVQNGNLVCGAGTVALR